MTQSLAPLGIVLYSMCVTLAVEFLNWAVVYRTQGYQTLKNTMELHLKRVDDAKTAAGSTAKSVKKREAKLDAWKSEAATRLAGYNLRTGLITVAIMMLAFRTINRIFGTEAVATLPFSPPPFLQKVFIFVLCQASVKVLTTKLAGVGPGREWATLKPKAPAGFMGLKTD